MAFIAIVRREGHSSGGDWLNRLQIAPELPVTYSWGPFSPILPSTIEQPLSPVPDLDGVLRNPTLIPSAIREDEHTYIIEVRDTDDPDARDIHVLRVGPSHAPDQTVTYTAWGAHGPTAGVRTTDGRPDQDVTITYDAEGRRTSVVIEES